MRTWRETGVARGSGAAEAAGDSSGPASDTRLQKNVGVASINTAFRIGQRTNSFSAARVDSAVFHGFCRTEARSDASGFPAAFAADFTPVPRPRKKTQIV